MLHANTILQAAHFLKEGQLVSLPTETVYGLAANALDTVAVRKIFEVKGRPLIDPLIIHVRDLKQAEALAHFTTEAYKVAEAFWPGPLTIILKKKPVVPDLVTAGLDTVAIRMPKHPLFRAVLEKAGIPLACPSANPFGYVSPTKAEHVEKTLGKKIAMVLDGGACEIGLESTILYLGHNEQPKIMRSGPISREDIEKVLECAVAQLEASATKKSNADEESQNIAQLAPGLLEKHYSPRCSIYLFEQGSAPKSSAIEAIEGKKIAVVYQKRPQEDIKPVFENEERFWLSEHGDLEDVARNLFDLMQVLDNGQYCAMSVERAPDSGIGRAINDRLSRAAAK
ncbi:MAG: threonylcarbamoyl-AMP synthase [Verrucomicrobia bacterium CG_4_10_14_3_um_filter_43_23]|nr:MAG: threonylcarbamoyl-AMP synthase [Verrucomicrobia bacterium CG1_02_43_26]PIP59165.1 MAG: threonylcarbamoyl-AMP synthase [Verrucomicrobia bacterium CG22_combo_CG10-13_8_21_14_all_43_17]PIX58441.1 MAG: threonylcarbamoyl-AMP synthase [Verrucomicrobia bacterium CG_4_10_14_3_um_filter_43_23]PIY60827.1 MAG: threonylcarbamoyl-AMP synthase [Verrucomicrobia bacterium CG_4_10_14_0_8_um_filter_43_34]PJA44883.1 MAG: threonylcarbamoyl-AMP synthase [Verrucomicrobia bacterium CG_4_9_14_3_um_filter_43_20